MRRSKAFGERDLDARTELWALGIGLRVPDRRLPHQRREHGAGVQEGDVDAMVPLPIGSYLAGRGDRAGRAAFQAR